MNGLTRLWYSRNILSYLLLPISWIYQLIITVRHCLYRYGVKKIVRFPVPIIVVGNLTVGGTGKTPLVIYLVELLRAQGYSPGVVSRGYGGGARHPLRVSEKSDVALVGDEAVLIVQKTQCPMIVAKNRVAAVTQLLANSNCNVVISDDGLQHYALGRDIEIAVIDGSRRFGNGFCLPAGPLREPVQRLKSVDFLVTNGGAQSNEYGMTLAPGKIYNISNPAVILQPENLQGKTLHAVAGIGNPGRFFQTLLTLKLSFIEHRFVDHHLYRPCELEFGKDAIIIMTEKDAVKCKAFADERFWCLPVEAKLEADFSRVFLEKLEIV